MNRVTVTLVDRRVEGFIVDGVLVVLEPLSYEETLEIAEGRAEVRA